MGITLTLSLILVIFTSLISYQAFNDESMKQKLLMHPARVFEFGEYFRFLTSGFVHANWSHLLINMFVLFMFGKQIEEVFISENIFGEFLGRALFLLLYLGAIIVSSVPSFIKHKNNGYYKALGASGGTSAIVFAYVLFAPWAWFEFPPLPGIIFAIGYIWYSSYMSKRGGDNIGHDAHMWGALYGATYMILISIIFKPELLNFFIGQLLEGPSMPNWGR